MIEMVAQNIPGESVRMSSELQRAYSDLLGELKAIEERLRTVTPPLDEPDLVEAYRRIFSLLCASVDVYVWADTGHPRFTDIVGPYRPRGGARTDNGRGGEESVSTCRN